MIIEPNYELMRKICTRPVTNVSMIQSNLDALDACSDVELVGLFRVPWTHRVVFEGIPFAESRFNDVKNTVLQVLGQRYIRLIEEI